MSTLHDALRGRIKVQKGLAGIEIETEVKEFTDYPKGFLVDGGINARSLQVWETPTLNDWIGNGDGSLRNFGVEFIFKKPLDYEDTIKALRDFGEKTAEIPFLEDQPSTSVHVHLNFSTERLLTLANFITVWTLYENVLLDFCGETRRSNLFASGVRTTEGIRENYLKLFSAIERGFAQGMAFTDGHVKYATLNLAALSKFGSLEVRCFRGTTKVEEIIEWIGILNRLMEFARTPGLTPASFLSSYHDAGPEMLSNVFGPYSDRLKCEFWEIMTERNLYDVYQLVSSVKNWETFGLKFTSIQESPRRNKSGLSIDPAVMAQFTQAVPGTFLSNAGVLQATMPEPTPLHDDFESNIEFNDPDEDY